MDSNLKSSNGFELKDITESSSDFIDNGSYMEFSGQYSYGFYSKNSLMWKPQKVNLIDEEEEEEEEEEDDENDKN
jgi:hypothetical protein